MTEESADALREIPAPYRTQDLPLPETRDPVLEFFKRDIDFTLVEKNLRLTTAERAQQLVNATHFLRKFRPLVAGENK